MDKHTSTFPKQFVQPVAFGWPYTLSPHDAGLVIEDVWPTLFFGVERLPEIKQKVNQFYWAQTAVEQMKAEAEIVLSKPPQKPKQRIGWRHDFYSHNTAEHLLYNPDSPDKHFDPSDGSWHGSEAQRRAWALLTHERTFRLMRSLSVLYGLTGDEKYATWVADGMRAAVEMFARDDLREGNNTEALYFQPLYDAQILLLLANSFGLTRNSNAYSESDRANIISGIFESAIPYQLRFFKKTGTHNMTCYVAAALATVGSLIGCEDWIEMALDDEKAGLSALLKNGLREDENGEPDGFWFEGTMFYHFKQHNGEDYQVLFIAGPHGAGHSHPDKLHVSLTARGECIAIDPGTAGYAVREIHKYYRSTLAHNTLLVDEKDQKPVKIAYLNFQPDATPAYALGRLEDAYEGIRLTREVFFEPPYLVLLDRCESDIAHRYGWIFHAYGSMSARVSSDIAPLDFPPLPEENAFAHFTNRSMLYTDGFLTVDWRVTDRIWLRLVVASDQNMEATLGRTPGNPRPDDRGAVFLRATGTTQRFFAAFEVNSGAPTLQGISTLSDGTHLLETATGAKIFSP